MKLGQTSVVYFGSKLTGAAIGFLATIYFARILGAEALGVYYLVIAVVAWLKIGGTIGVSSAITKRLSEERDEEAHLTAGVISTAIMFSVTAITVLALQSYIKEYTGYAVIELIILLLFVEVFKLLLDSILKGQHLVHIAAILSPLRTASASVLQISAVFLGLGVTGLILGKIAGLFLVMVIALYFASLHISRPKPEHFKSIYNYAKYSWLGIVRGKTFNQADILILGVFVPSSLVGVYSIAWTIVYFLHYFATAISTTLFPEISKLSTNSDYTNVRNLIESAIGYSGVIAIPGLVGAILLDERILQLYGEEFTVGTSVLGLLVFGVLLWGYQKQLINSLNAIDRPDLGFRATLVFVITNILLNLYLVWSIGWIGAAIATVLSAAVSLTISYWYLSRIVSFRLPVIEISRQLISAIMMGAIIYAALYIEESLEIVSHNTILVVLLVGLGAVIYFISYLSISKQFRSTVGNNIPSEYRFL